METCPMTNLTTEHQATPSTVSAASAATLAEHSDARWADWQRRGDDQDERLRRRFWIIASVIAAGLLVWLLVTSA
jgi:hypothetical protein